LYKSRKSLSLNNKSGTEPNDNDESDQVLKLSDEINRLLFLREEMMTLNKDKTGFKDENPNNLPNHTLKLENIDIQIEDLNHPNERNLERNKALEDKMTETRANVESILSNATISDENKIQVLKQELHEAVLINDTLNSSQCWIQRQNMINEFQLEVLKGNVEQYIANSLQQATNDKKDKARHQNPKDENENENESGGMRNINQTDE